MDRVLAMEDVLPLNLYETGTGGISWLQSAVISPLAIGCRQHVLVNDILAVATVAAHLDAES